MDISLKKNVGFIVKNFDGKKCLVSDKSVKEDTFDIVVALGNDGKGFLINQPGEYEIAQISVLTQAGSSEDKYDIAELIVDDISIVFVFEGFKYSKRIHDNLGDIDVLVSYISKSEDLKEIVSKFDPEIIIPSDPINGEKLLKELGINNISQSPSLKIKHEQFGGEEFIVQGVILN